MTVVILMRSCWGKYGQGRQLCHLGDGLMPGRWPHAVQRGSHGYARPLGYSGGTGGKDNQRGLSSPSGTGSPNSPALVLSPGFM